MLARRQATCYEVNLYSGKVAKNGCQHGELGFCQPYLQFSQRLQASLTSCLADGLEFQAVPSAEKRVQSDVACDAHARTQLKVNTVAFLAAVACNDDQEGFVPLMNAMRGIH